jgi:uncharacterized membrane protein
MKLLFVLLVLSFLPPSLGLCFSPPQDAVSMASQKLTDFDRDIAPILKNKCLSCHQGETAKNGFDISDRDSLLGFLVPGDTSSSSLWTDYLIQPPRTKQQDSLVMPPDGPLSTSELATLKLWIDEGADWPTDSAVGIQPLLGNSSSGSSSWISNAYAACGYFHPAMVHFPIALFLVGGLVSFLSYFLGTRCMSTAYQCLVVASLSSVVTVVMGWSFAETQGYPSWDKMLPSDATHEQSTLFLHRWLGSAVAVIGMIAVAIGLLARKNNSDRLHNAWRVLAIVLALMVAWVGHQGGELVYGEIFDKAMERLMK